MPKRAWCAMALDWYKDAVLDAVADDHPIALALWPMLVAMCTDASHVTKNPEGALEVTAGQLARWLRTDKQAVQGALDAMAEGELLRVEQRGKSPVVILCRFGKYQKPKGSRAFAKREQRAESVCRENDSQGTGIGPNMSHPPVPIPIPSHTSNTLMTGSEDYAQPVSQANIPPDAWVHEAASNILEVVTGVDRNLLTQKILDAKAYGLGKSRTRFEPVVYIEASKQFRERIEASPLGKPEAWWSYYAKTVEGVALGGAAVDSDAKRESDRVSRLDESVRQAQAMFTKDGAS